MKKYLSILIVNLILIIFFIELIFIVLNKLSETNYFENRYETEGRYYKEISLAFNRENIYKKNSEYEKIIGIYLVLKNLILRDQSYQQ